MQIAGALVPRGEELQVEVTVDERDIPAASPDNLLYFKSIGGYKPETIDMEKITGGKKLPPIFSAIAFRRK